MKKVISYLIILSLLTPAVSKANEAVDVSKDQPAPFSGTLLDSEKARNVEKELIEKDGLQKENDSLNKSIQLYKSNEDILTQKNDLLLKQNDELLKNINDARKTTDLEKFGYFALGIIAAALAVKGASQLRK